jgi:hypothetical protein
MMLKPFRKAKYKHGHSRRNLETFKEAIETCIEKHIPKKKIGKHHDVPWMTTDIKRLIRKKQLCCLLILGVMFVVTDNISWSLFPIGGHVVVLVTSVGCDVIMRSNILSFRVGSSLQELGKSLSKIKSDKRYRNAKIFLGGDFNLGNINWTTGGTIPGGRNISQSNILINVLNNFYLEQINELPNLGTHLILCLVLPL